MKERGKIEKFWREEKYRVLLHDQISYNDIIRQTLKEKTSLLVIQAKIDKAITIPPTKGSIINAYEHMWGYFKNQASIEEKLKARCLKEKFLNNELSLETLLKFLKHLSVKYEVTYLQQSTILNI